MNKTLEERFNDKIKILKEENEQLKEELNVAEDALNFILMGGLEEENE